ncbi:MAG: hypothetical protein GX591_15315 [Planctomycetes bacterium]|nr:hypothetical protein [Planctomycetota bacterium]
MDHNTREVLGHLTRWCVLGGAVLLGVLAAGTELWALQASVQAARARAVMPDVVGRVGTHARLAVLGRPALHPSIPGYYWREAGGRLGDVYMGKNGVAWFPLPADVQPGRLEFHAVVNPYSAQAPGWGRASVFLYPRGTNLVLLDARALPIAAAPSEGSDGEDPPGVLWLARLAEERPVAYLTPVPLDAYDACRRALRRGPAGAVLPAADTWRTPADLEALIAALGQTRQRLRHDVTLVTADPTLAEAARAEGVAVVLVGAEPADVQRGVNVPDWTAAHAWLTDPAR